MKPMIKLFLGFLLLGLVACSDDQPEPEAEAVQSTGFTHQATIILGDLQLYRQGKALPSQGVRKLEAGDLLMVGPKGEVKISLQDGGELILGGNAILMVQPWAQEDVTGTLSLEYGQARFKSGPGDLVLRTSHGLLELSSLSKMRVATSPQMITLYQEMGTGELITSYDSEWITEEEAVVCFGKIESATTSKKSLQIGDDLNSPKQSEMDSPGLWPIDPWVQLELLDLEDLADYQKSRRDSFAIYQGTNFQPLSLKAAEEQEGVILINDQKPLIDPMKEKLNIRPLGDVAKVIISFEK